MAAHHLRRRSMGLVKVLNQCFWNSCLHPLPSSVVRRTLGAVSCDSPTIFYSCRFGSTEAQKQQSYSGHDDEENFIQAMDFRDGKVTFTSEMRFIFESPEKRVPCYLVLDENGNPIMHSSFVQLSTENAVKIYSSMVTLQTMDTIFYEAQRQGRISFYVTSNGEEAINIASAAALTPDDVILPQYAASSSFRRRLFSQNG